MQEKLLKITLRHTQSKSAEQQSAASDTAENLFPDLRQCKCPIEQCHTQDAEKSAQRRRSLAQRVGKEHVFQADFHYPTEAWVRRRRLPIGRGVSRNAVVRRVGVQACRALYRAVRLGQPHTHALLTVAGNAVRHPQNVMVPFGTSVQEILHRCGVVEDPTYLIVGEIMTGVTSTTQDIPVLPGMTCVLAFTAEQVRLKAPRACIGCGRCSRICHAGLLPFEIYRRYENMHYERLSSLAVGDCDGCGACSYVCPCGLELAAVVQEAKHAGNTILLDLEEDTDA